MARNSRCLHNLYTSKMMHISISDSQVLRVLPYSACQLCSYEAYKRLLGGGPNGEGLSVPCRLAAGAAAGMTSTLVRPALRSLDDGPNFQHY